MEYHGLQTYINTRHSTFSHRFSQSTFCSCGVDMAWFCSFWDKSFSRKDNMQRHLISKHLNTSLSPFHTAPMRNKSVRGFFSSILLPAWLQGWPSRERQSGFDLFTTGIRIAWNSSDWFESFSPLNNVWIDRPLMPSRMSLTTRKPGSDFDWLIV